MSTNKKFRVQNGIDVTGEVVVGGVTVIAADGTVVSDLSDQLVPLQNEVAALEVSIENILGTSPETLDTLQEIVASFQGADGDLQTLITTNATGIATNATAITDEETARIAADAALQSAVDAANARTSGISTSSGSSNIQMTADVDMDSNAVTNMADPSSAQDAATKAYVDAADTTLQGNITTEASSRASGDANLQSQVDALSGNVGGLSTTDIPEGSNQYYTDARVRAAVQAGTGMSYEQSTGEFSVSLSGGDGISVSGGTISIDGTAIAQDLVPSVDDTYSLGSPDKVWKDVYIGPGSLYLNGTKILEDNSGTITMYADAGQNLSFGATGGGSIDLNAGDESIQIKSDLVLSAGETISTVGGVATPFGGQVNMQTHKVVNVGTPTADADAATKAYVDGRVDAGSISGDKTFSNNVVVSGNLTVQGTTTTVNSETISLADNIIDVNSNVTSGNPTENAGLRVMRGDSPASQLRWNEANDYWETFDGSDWTKVALSTTDLAEGSNQYFTDARAQSAVAGDISSAVAAEAVLRADADTAEASARASADASLQSDIDGEIARAQGVEAGLDSDISVNAAGVASNAAAIAQEVTDRTGAVATVQSNVDAEEAARIAADGGLQTQITALDAKHDSDHAAMISSLAGETTARISGDGNLQTQIDAVEAAVEAITNGSVASLDTLVEVVNAFENADSDLQAVITGNTSTISGVNTRVGTLEGEMDAVQALSSTNSSLLSNHGPRISTNETNISSLQTFSGEGTVLGTAAVSLAAAINEIHSELNSVVADLGVEVGRATGVEAGLDSDISAEAVARANADTSLQSQISSEIARATSAESGLSGDISAETTARVQGDANLQSQIDSLSTSITDEGNGRDSDVSDLQAQINSILSNTDQAAIDSLTEVVAAFQSADNSLGTLITQNQTTLGLHGGRLDAIEAWDTDNVSEGSLNLYFTEARARGCVSADAGSCIDYNESTGKFSLDVSEVESAVTPDNATNADKLDGQHGSHYRIDIYDINGTVVN